jgi:hypothetical protein
MGKTTDIREAVEAELKFDPHVDDADIHVMNAVRSASRCGTGRCSARPSIGAHN